MDRYAIRNTSGQWWTGSCWGVEQARAIYTESELPEIIDLPHSEDEIALRCDSCCNDPADTLYVPDFDADDDNDGVDTDPVASVYRVGP